MAGWRDGLKKVGTSWQYRFLFKGVLYTGSTRCTAMADARSWLAAYKSRLSRGEVGDLDAPTVTRAFNDWLKIKEGFCSQANLDRAKRAMERHVLPVIGTMKADQVRSNDVARVVQTYLKAKGPRGRERTADGANVVIAYLRAVFNHLVENGYLTKVPFRIKKQKTQVKPRTTLPLDKIEPFLAHIDQHAHRHIGVAVRFMLWLGLRETEALGVRREWLRGTTRYTHGKTKGKEAVERALPEDLQALIEGLPKDSAWILPGADDKPHCQQFTRKAILRAGVAVGVPGLTPHRLRATYATLLSQTGASIYEVQKLLRHKDISTTLHYVQVDEASLDRASLRLYQQAHQTRCTKPDGPDVAPDEAVSSLRLASGGQIVTFTPMTWTEPTNRICNGNGFSVTPQGYVNAPVA